MSRITSGTLTRVAKYAIVRAVLLLLSVLLGVFLAIIAINYAGYIDDIFREGVEYGLFELSQILRDVPTEEKLQILEQARWEMEETAGLHEPFLARCFRWLGYGLTLDWGNAGQTRVGVWVLGTGEAVLPIILGRLRYTLLLAGSANVLLFFGTVALALVLSRKHGSWLDRLLITLSPLSSVPSWIHGILLIVIFAAGLHLLPFGGMFGDEAPDRKLAYIPIVLKHMILPVAAIFLSGFFQSVYAWRSCFLLHADEDYVELARAKGLPSRLLERRHILRPALPNVLTSFALMLISFWQGAIILEVFFDWPGIGKLFIESIQTLNRPFVVGLVVIFAYFLAITLFFLDVLCAIVDPRVRVGGASQTVRATIRRRRLRPAPGWPRSLGRRLTCLGRAPPGAERRVFQDAARFQPPERLLAESDAPALVSGDQQPAQKIRRKRSRRLKPMLREVARHPAVLVGLSIILSLVGVSVYALITMPYDETIVLWRGEGNAWYQNPKMAPPQWINLFHKANLPPTIILDSRDRTSEASKRITPASEGMVEMTLSFPFDFPYGAFPQDLLIRFEAQYDEKRPYLSLTWLRPDGRVVDMGHLSVSSVQTYYLSQDRTLRRRLDGGSPIQALFADPSADAPVPLRGAYELQVSAFLFEEDADLDAEFVLHGQVHGLAGTDHRRRDLVVALLWGMPLALVFGLLAAVVTATTTVVIAAVGAWFGGWIDIVIQRVTEVNMILPVIPICITLYLASSKSIWVILSVVVLLNIFGSAIKNYRAVFLQVKEEPHLDAARAYGAPDRRIILRYLLPRIVPVLIPHMILLIPSYIFLEAMLAYLGVSDPALPTWGKLIEAGVSHGLYTGAYHMLLAPLSLLLLLGLAFVMLSLALERIFQSRLRKL